MLLPARVLRHHLMAPTQLPRPFEQNLVGLIVLDVLGVDTHAGTNSIQRILKLRRREEWQSRISPLLPHETLGLKRGRPIHRSAAAPGGACDDAGRTVVRDDHAAVHEQVVSAVGLRHRQIFRRPVVRLVDEDYAMSCFGEILRGNGTTAAAANYDNIGLYDLGFVRWVELQELVAEPFPLLMVTGRPRVAQDFT